MTGHRNGVGCAARRRATIHAMSETETDMTETKIALVTGANKGIGYEIATGLGALGYRVGVGARDRGRLESAVEKLRAAGVDAFGVPLDVTDDLSVSEAVGLV